MATNAAAEKTQELLGKAQDVGAQIFSKAQDKLGDVVEGVKGAGSEVSSIAKQEYSKVKPGMSEVAGAIREEMPVLREAVSDLRHEPKTAFAKIAAVAKDIWDKIMEVGLLGAIGDSIKGFFRGIWNSVRGRSDIASAIPEAPTERPHDLRAEAQPLLSSSA